MDENFENWKSKNKAFCEQATVIQQQMLYITEGVMLNLNDFRNDLKNLRQKHKEIDINRIINKMGSIRTFIRHSQGQSSKL